MSKPMHCPWCMIENMMQDEFFIFMSLMKAKFLKRQREKNRSLQPWDKFDKEWLNSRLLDEFKEWRDSNFNDPDELLDIANFSLFLYVRMTRDIFYTMGERGVVPGTTSLPPL